MESKASQGAMLDYAVVTCFRGPQVDVRYWPAGLCFYRFWATILPTLGVQVHRRVGLPGQQGMYQGAEITRKPPYPNSARTIKACTHNHSTQLFPRNLSSAPAADFHKAEQLFMKGSLGLVDSHLMRSLDHGSYLTVWPKGSKYHHNTDIDPNVGI